MNLPRAGIKIEQNGASFPHPMLWKMSGATPWVRRYYRAHKLGSDLYWILVPDHCNKLTTPSVINIFQLLQSGMI
jgi:hypothetical protein